MNAEFAAFPGSSRIGTLQTGRETVDLDDVVGVLYRRPAQFRLPDGMTDEHRTLARVEARHGFGGVLTSIEARWANHPLAISDGNFKPRQLHTAAAAGMSVPRTLITNSPEQARKFACELGKPIIYKVFEPPILPDQKVILTTVVDPNELDDPAIQLTAHMFQEQISKEFDAEGLTDFAIVHSYLDTATKLGLDKPNALRTLFTTGAWLPPALTPTE